MVRAMVAVEKAAAEEMAAARARVEAAIARTDTARVAQLEVVTETGTERSTSPCSSCRTSCSQLLRATCSPPWQPLPAEHGQPVA